MAPSSVVVGMLIAFIGGVAVTAGFGSRWGHESLIDLMDSLSGMTMVGVTVMIAREAHKIALMQAVGSPPTVTVHRTEFRHPVPGGDEVEVRLRVWNNHTYGINAPVVALESVGNKIIAALAGGKKSIASWERLILQSPPGSIGPGACQDYTVSFKLDEGELPSNVYRWEILYFDPKRSRTVNLTGKTDWASRDVLR